MYYSWRSLLVCGDIIIHNNNIKVGERPTNGLTVMKTVYTEIYIDTVWSVVWCGGTCGLPLFLMSLQETCSIEIFSQEISLFHRHQQNISGEYRRVFNKKIQTTMQYTLYLISLHLQRKEWKERTQTRCSFTIHWFYDIIYGNQTGLLKLTVFSYFIKKRRGFFPANNN